MALFFKDESMTLMPASLENGFTLQTLLQKVTIPCFGDVAATTSGDLRFAFDLRG
jgi:hypothetical protein